MDINEKNDEEDASRTKKNVTRGGRRRRWRSVLFFYCLSLPHLQKKKIFSSLPPLSLPFLKWFIPPEGHNFTLQLWASKQALLYYCFLLLYIITFVSPLYGIPTTPHIEQELRDFLGAPNPDRQYHHKRVSKGSPVSTPPHPTWPCSKTCGERMMMMAKETYQKCHFKGRTLSGTTTTTRTTTHCFPWPAGFARRWKKIFFFVRSFDPPTSAREDVKKCYFLHRIHASVYDRPLEDGSKPSAILLVQYHEITRRDFWTYERGKFTKKKCDI